MLVARITSAPFVGFLRAADFGKLIGESALTDIARTFGVSHTTIGRLVDVSPR